MHTSKRQAVAIRAVAISAVAIRASAIRASANIQSAKLPCTKMHCVKPNKNSAQSAASKREDLKEAKAQHARAKSILKEERPQMSTAQHTREKKSADKVKDAATKIQQQ